jgi:methyl-accepting chemotaxis protein
MVFLNNLKISTKFVVCVAPFVVAGLLSILGMREIALTTHIQKMERDHVETVTRFGYKASQYLRLHREATPESIAAAEELLAARSSMSSQMGIYQLVDLAETLAYRLFEDTNFIEEFAFRHLGFDRVFDLAAEDIEYMENTRAALSAYNKQEISLDELEEQCRATIKFVDENAPVFASQVRDASIFTRNTGCILVMGAMAFALMVLFMVARAITVPLKAGVKFAQNLADGDLTQQLEITQKDEIGDLAQAMNQMTANLNGIVVHIGAAAAEMEVASKEQATGAMSQCTATTQMSVTVRELLAAARQVNKNGTSVSEQAEQATKECGIGTKSIQDTVEGIVGIRERVETIAEHIVGLSGKSQQISGVLDIINELSDQTNLLSLNASIEAAGAGEAGKRFAVVASEIRKLAERAAESTTEIRGLIEDIQETVNTTIVAAEGGTKAVEQGMRQTADLQGSFERITNQVASTTQSAKAIELSSRQQTTAIEQMDDAVRGIDTAAKQSESTSRQVQTEAQALAEAARRFKTGK